MKTQSWGNTFQFPQHATLASISQGKTVEAGRPATPPPADLKPGDTVQFSTKAEPERFISWNQDDRLVFKNGASVQDLPGESGLLVTAPDGKQTQVGGWVDRDDEGQPVVYTRTHVADQDEWMEWKQSFPSQGGLLMERLPQRGEADRRVAISPSGEIAVEAEQWGEPVNFQASLNGPALVLQNDSFGEASVPAIPIEWFIGK